VVAELLGALELVIADPLLQQLLLALLDDRLGQLQRLLRVELALLQQHAEVGEDGRRLPRRGRGLLEARDGVGRAQDLLRRLCGELGGALVVALVHQVVELLHEELLGAGQVVTHGHLDSEREVVELLAHVRHEVGLVDGDAQHLSLAVDTHDATRGLVRSGHEDGLRRDTVHVHEGSRLEVVQVQVAEIVTM